MLNQDTLYLDNIEERENAGTPQIIQTIRAALAFWVKEYIGCEEIVKQEHVYAERALKRLLPNRNIKVLGNTSAKRQAILSFIIYSTSNSTYLADFVNGSGSEMITRDKEKVEKERLFMWAETGKNRDKPLDGHFVAALLNDLFGIQARGGCACAGPYGHDLLNMNETESHAFRSLILQVTN